MAGVRLLTVPTTVGWKRSNPWVEHRGDGEPCLYGQRQNRTPATGNVRHQLAGAKLYGS
jgi:hypothetical protein